MSDLDAHLNRLRKALQDHADKVMGGDWRAMVSEGIHTGHLNALHQISPHCSKTIEEADYWYAEGIKYLNEWKLRPDGGTEA